MKKHLTLALVTVLLLSLLCPAALAADGSREHVTFWCGYTNTDEVATVQQVVEAYNASQDKYEVEMVSAGSDIQKIIVAIANGEGPDAYQVSNSNLISLVANGLLAPLTPYIEAENFDLGAYSTKAIEAVSIDDQVYGLPFGINIIQMFYNKDLLAAHGYSEPPQTWEELYEMAIAVTTLDENGNIDVLGYPCFPFASARQELIYGFGGRWWAEDGVTLTPNSQGVLDSLNMNVAYRKEYGIDKVQTFLATANTNRYTEQDMFFAGKQLFRLDGPWLATMIEEYNPEVNYGVTMVPGTKDHPEYRGSSRFEATAISIPVNAEHKEGAYDFIKYYTASKELVIGLGNLPAVKTLWDDEDVQKIPVFHEFIEALREERGITYPKIKDLAKYNSLIEEHLDYVYNGVMSPEDAMNLLNEQAQILE